MKKLLLISIAIVITGVLYAQAPQAFKYQAVLRDSNDDLIVSQAVTLQITIENSTTDVYVETHSVTTSQFGLVTLNIGEGTVVSGVFATIDWGADTYSVKVEVDAGSGYEDMGTSQLLSVPYALYSGSDVPGGVTSQTLRHNGTNWIADSMIVNNGDGVRINYHPNQGPQFNTFSTLAIFNDSNAMTTGVNDSHLALRLINHSQIDNKGVGIGFSNSTEYQTVGAKIVFLRTAGFSVGDLCFFTKSSVSSGDNSTEKMRITSLGRVGIGTTTPTQSLHIKQQTSGAGLVLEHNTTSNNWTIGTAATNNLWFQYNGSLSAWVSYTDGLWTTSDKQLKTNFDNLGSILDKVVNLKTYEFSYKNAIEDRRTIGFISQEVEELFPLLVVEENGVKFLNYSLMSVVSIKAIQEQQLIIESQQHQIDELQKQIDELRQMIIEK